MLLPLVGAPNSARLDNICQLLLLLSFQLVTVNYSPFYIAAIYSGSLFVGAVEVNAAGVCQFLGWEHVRILLIKT